MVKTALLLFGKEIEKLKKSGFKYKFVETSKGIYVVEVDIPKRILDTLEEK